MAVAPQLLAVLLQVFQKPLAHNTTISVVSVPLLLPVVVSCVEVVMVAVFTIRSPDRPKAVPVILIVPKAHALRTSIMSVKTLPISEPVEVERARNHVGKVSLIVTLFALSGPLLL